MKNGPGEKRWPCLPDGYYLDETTDHDLLILRRRDCSEAAVFGERADVEEVEQTAWDDYSGRGRAKGNAPGRGRSRD